MWKCTVSIDPRKAGWNLVWMGDVCRGLGMRYEGVEVRCKITRKVRLGSPAYDSVVLYLYADELDTLKQAFKDIMRSCGRLVGNELRKEMEDAVRVVCECGCTAHWASMSGAVKLDLEDED